MPSDTQRGELAAGVPDCAMDCYDWNGSVVTTLFTQRAKLFVPFRVCATSKILTIITVNATVH